MNESEPATALPADLNASIEALLLASDEPMGLQKLRSLLGEDVASSDIRAAISELESHYDGRGIRICMVGGGWQFRTAPEHGELIRQLWQVKPPRLSRSALETLAIIAYRQPTTRAEIEALRGVKVSSNIIASLQERGWIKVLGRKEVPGRPHLYGTGKQFLIDFELNSLKDLPDSAQLMDEEEIQQIVSDNEANQENQAEQENNREQTEEYQAQETEIDSDAENITEDNHEAEEFDQTENEITEDSDHA